MNAWAALRAEYPLWCFEHNGGWSASGPGRPPTVYSAERDGRRLLARSVDDLRARLAEAEAAEDCPPASRGSTGQNGTTAPPISAPAGRSDCLPCDHTRKGGPACLRGS